MFFNTSERPAFESCNAAKVASNTSNATIYESTDSHQRSAMSPEEQSDLPAHAFACTEPDKIEPIAVIGLALRFPQDATSPQKFWEMLMKKESAMTDVPRERYNVEAFYEEGEHQTGVLGVKGGHFIKEDVAGFDAPFFSVTPGEAECMDPQQRWLLETAYETLENAGIPMEQASGSKTSVHIGCFMRDYELMLMNDPEMHAIYKTTGTASAMLANRLSWFYNLKGPSLSLDTACSSSLTALHLACQSIRCGESEMGLVGGCNLFFSPDISTSMTDLGFLSPDSRSYSFDHRANGYSRGEAFTMVLIKPLRSAIRDGNTIRAVIRATSANQDGRTPGLTQPSSKAQEQMIRDAYISGGLDLSETRYFEAHGTGTSVGDPIEADAIRAVFTARRTKDQPLYVGAVKTNIGHTEGASGLAGLIKTILVLEKAVIPPNALFERVNPRINPLDWNIHFPQKPVAWPSQSLRRASVSSFGFGGANAHAVLDDAFNYLRLRDIRGSHNTREVPPNLTELESSSLCDYNLSRIQSCKQHTAELGDQPRLLILSAFDEVALKARLDGLHQYLTERGSMDDDTSFLDELALTLSKKRDNLPCRTFVVAQSKRDLEARLQSNVMPSTRVALAPKLGFVFTGQGAQWPSMGKELLVFPVYKESLHLAGLHLRSLGCQWDLINEITSPELVSKMDLPAYSQPLCTALQVALVDLLASWGIFPTTVIGHSSGEIAAAYSAGALTRESAWSLAYHRGTVAALSKSLSNSRLAMMAVGLSETDFQGYWARTQMIGGDVSIACFNSAQSITISGCKKRIDAIKQTLDDSGVFARKLKVDVAYHTSYMENVSSLYKELIGDLSMPSSESMKATMVSSVTGTEVCKNEIIQSDYWVDNLISPVRFMQAVENAFSPDGNESSSRSVEHLLEVGPHCTLQGPLKQTSRMFKETGSVEYSSVMVRGKPSLSTALEAMGQLFCRGFPVDIAKANRSSEQTFGRIQLGDLPSYPWNHSKKYWLESRISKNYRLCKFPRLELLGTRVPDWNHLEARWRNIIRLSEKPWIADHKVNGTVVYPAAGMLVMAIEAMRQTSDFSQKLAGYHFRNVAIQRALIVQPTDSLEIQLTLRPLEASSRNLLQWASFRICVYENEDWAEVCSGESAVEYVRESQDDEGAKEARYDQLKYRQEVNAGSTNCTKTVDVKDVYESIANLGISYGPTFATLKNIRYNDNGETTVSVNLAEWERKSAKTPQGGRHVIHPAALDAILQSVFPALSEGGTKSFPTLVPTKFRKFWLAADLERLDDANVNIFTTANFVGLRNADSTIRAISSATGDPCVIGSYEMTFVSGHDRPIGGSSRSSRLCYHIDSRPDLTLLNPSQIDQYCSSGIEPGFSDLKIQQEEDKRLACYMAVYNSLESRPSKELSTAMPHLERYSDWIRHQISYNSKTDISLPEEQWKACAGIPHHRQQLFDKVQKYDAEGRVIHAVGTNLPSILSGEVDGLGLLFGEDSLMEQYYSYAHSSTSAFSKVERYVDALAHKDSAIRVLEIGAGTGGATQRIMQALTGGHSDFGGSARFVEYMYTDISPSFFDKARAKFTNVLSKMKFATLNIEQDPIEQGFQEAGYDLIIASHVLHATRNMETTLQHTRRLLRDGGKLISYETVTPEAILPAFIFGILPGWWLGEEDNRKWGPLLNESEWSISLTKSGFTGVDLSLGNDPDAPQRSGSAIISTATKTDLVAPSLIDTVIIRAGDSQFEQKMINELKTKLDTAFSINCRVRDLDDESNDLNQSICILLHELHQPLLHNISESAYRSLHRVISACQSLLWITNEKSENPENQLVQGFARCIREESKGLKFITASLDISKGFASLVDKISLIYRNAMLASEDGDLEYVEKNDMLFTNRLVEADMTNYHVHSKTTSQPPKLESLGHNLMHPLKLSIAAPGMLDSLEFRDDLRAKRPLLEDEVEIEIKAGGLNFRDVLIALGQVTGDHLGGEAAGIVTRCGSNTGVRPGDRVVGFVEGSFATVGRTKSSHIHIVPENLSFVAAAALPTIYCTAHYLLSHWGRMKPGETILIHSAAGGFGQAVIQLAKLYEAEIYVTVGSDEKRQFLHDTYDIPMDHMFSSRSDSFAKGIKRMTGDRGVDVVVNSLAGEALRLSWECIAPFGRFIEVGKKDIYNYSTLPMYQFAKNVTFACVDLVHLLDEEPEVAGSLLRDVMKMLQSGRIAGPQPLHLYKSSQIEEAFRYMQSGKSIGKIVVEFNADDIVPTVPSMLPTWDFDPEATYLISGGFGGLGRCTARWMASRNAKNLILLGRQGAKSTDAQQLLNELTMQGVTVAAPPCDVTKRDILADVLSECEMTMPPIKGCIVGTMVLKDSAFESMSYSDFQTPIDPKVAGTHNLHTLLPTNLDFFICLSSMSGIIGVPGQSNYGAGNSYQDALTHRRIAAGQKSVSLNLGVVLSVGYVAEHERVKSMLKDKGYMGIREDEYLALLDYYCDPRLPVLPPSQCQVVTGLQIPAELHALGIPEAYYMQAPLFRHLRQIGANNFPSSLGSNASSSQNADALSNLQYHLENAKTWVDVKNLALDGLTTKVSKSLDVSKEQIDTRKPLHAYGVDSLVAVELRGWLRRDMGAEVTTFEILGNSSVADLAQMVAQRSRYVSTAIKEDHEESA